MAYPRQHRAEFGPEMVQVVQDRQIHGGEPAWRLWPQLLADTATNAGKARWDVVIERYRALLVAGLATVALLAALSDGIRGLAIVAVAGGAALLLWRSKPSTAGSTTPSSRAWLTVGVLLLACAVVNLVIAGDDEMSEPQWFAMFASLMIGAFTLITGLLLRIARR
ncbi:MAG: hypothetical protein M3Z03_08580 [Actinomycetota bacterium]|nr:hypothetical protein [Actinomycetota bacterium]